MAIGGTIWWLLSACGIGVVGVVIFVLLAVIGYSIGTFKVPNSVIFDITRKTGGENIDDVIMRWFKFKTKNKKKIYIYYF